MVTKTYIIKAAGADVPVFGYGNDKAERDKEFGKLVKRDGAKAWVKRDVRTALDVYHDRMKDRIIPWPRVARQEVKTCGIEEDALGLTKMIGGWCQEGYYVGYGVRKQTVQKAMDQIYWRRLALIQTEFEVRMDSTTTMVITDRPTLFVTEKRYQRLVRQCMIAVPEATFERELEKARATCKSQKSAHVSGSLDGSPRHAA